MAIDTFSLAGKAALVTGAGAGIGRACTLALARAGARVMATDLDEAAAAKTAALAAVESLKVSASSMGMPACLRCFLKLSVMVRMRVAGSLVAEK